MAADLYICLSVVIVPDHIPLPGFQARMFEFDDFEKKFEVSHCACCCRCPTYCANVLLTRCSRLCCDHCES